MPVDDTLPEEQIAELVKENVASSHEEESSIECDFVPVTEDRREPVEDSETASEDRASAEPPMPPPSQLRNPAAAAAPLRSTPRKGTPPCKAVQSNIPSPCKPTITIDRRARSMPVSPTNSIASVMYIEPPSNAESFFGVDMRDDFPLDSSANKETRPESVNGVTAYRGDSMATVQAYGKEDEAAGEIKIDDIRDVGTPASPTPSGMSSEHTMDELYQFMLRELNVENPSVTDYASMETDLARSSKDDALEEVNTSSNVGNDSASATGIQIPEKKVESVSRIGRSSLANVRYSSRRRARQLSGLGKQLATSSKTNISDSSKVVASTTKTLAATSSMRLSATTKSVSSKSKSIASASKTVVADLRARSKSRARHLRNQRKEGQTSKESCPGAESAENQKEQEVSSPGNTRTENKGVEAEECMPPDSDGEACKGASAEESLEVIVFPQEETSHETVKTTTAREESDKTGVAEELALDSPGKSLVCPSAVRKTASTGSTAESIAEDEANASESDSTESAGLMEGTARSVEEAPAVNWNTSSAIVGLSSVARIRGSSRKRIQQLSGLGKKLADSSKTVASHSSIIISSTSKSIATSSKSAVANARARSRSRVRGSETPRQDVTHVEDLSEGGKEFIPVKAAEEKTEEPSDAKTDGTAAGIRSSSRKRAHQWNGLRKKFTDSSKTIASNSSKRISSTSKSMAISPRNAVSKIRARSRSRAPIAKIQSEGEAKFVEVSSKEINEFLSVKLSDENPPPDSRSNDAVVPTDDDVKAEIQLIKSTDDNQLTYSFTEVQGDSDHTDFIAPCDAENNDTEKNVPLSIPDTIPSTSPPKATIAPNGFVAGFRNFARITEHFFCKTEEYLGDFTTICGGEASPAATIEANSSMQEKGDVRATSKDEPTVNSVEVSPIFDDPEPSVVEPIGGISLVDGDKSPFPEEKYAPTTEVEPILVSLDTTHSLELGQSSSLRSTKSNKSLTLLTEVETKPSTESLLKVIAPVQGEDLPIDTVDSANVNADLASAYEVRSQSELRSNEEQSGLLSTEVLHENITPETLVESAPETLVESAKAHTGQKNLNIRASFFKKPGQGRVDDSARDNKDSNEPKSHFSVMRSLKSGLKHLPPRGDVSNKGFSRLQGKDSVGECVSSSVNLTSTQKLIDHYDADGMRVYGGGVTVAVNEPTQYPKHPLYYRRKKSRIRKHVNHMRETAKNMNKVIQQSIVTASQPRMKAIMTNHVYHKDQASNRLH